MVDSSLFTYKEAVELILGFYTFTSRYCEEELVQIPEAKRFVDMGFGEKVEDGDLYVLSEAGKEVLHEYIKSISEFFIKHMTKKGFEMSCAEVSEWFKQEFKLETDDDSEAIADYICSNLGNYGYKVIKCYSRHKGNFYRLERL